jgi:tripartite-type tricarboxylate transporter receptor subunit TctC
MRVSKGFATTLALAGGFAGFAGVAESQQVYPSRPIRIISPYAPGGGNTIMSRLVGDKLTEAWGQQVIVDNRPGGNTLIGTELAARATPDGYTFLLAGSAHVLVPLVFKAPYDPIKDFAAVGTVGKNEFILVASQKVPANDLKQLIALAKSKPGSINYATFGAGTTTHLSIELFSNLVGVRMQHIPYKGTGPAITDLLGGHVDIFLSTAAPVIPHIQSGRLKGIAISGDQRAAAIPNVPTFAEAGVPGFEASGWYGVVAPAATPKAIIDKVSGVIASAMATPEIKTRLNSMGVEPLISTPQQFDALMKAETAKWLKVLKTGSIKLEQ